MLAVIGCQGTYLGAAEHVRLLQNLIEHRREVAGGGIDDPQYLGGRGLLSERLVALGCTLGKPPL